MPQIVRHLEENDLSSSGSRLILSTVGTTRETSVLFYLGYDLSAFLQVQIPWKVVQPERFDQRTHGSQDRRRRLVDFTEALPDIPRSRPARRRSTSALVGGARAPASTHLPYGTQKGDVYSFAIILQELILRNEPYDNGGSCVDIRGRDEVFPYRQKHVHWKSRKCCT